MSQRRSPPAPAPAPVVPGTTSQRFPYGGRAGQYMVVKPDGSGLELKSPTYVVEHHTATDTLTQAESGSIHTNLGAGSSVTLNLPVAPKSGVWFHFIVLTGYDFVITPGAADAIYINGAKQADGKYIDGATINESVKLVSNSAGDWIAMAKEGSWVVQA